MRWSIFHLRLLLVLAMCGGLLACRKPTRAETMLAEGLADIEERLRALPLEGAPDINSPFIGVDAMLELETAPVHGKPPAEARRAFHAAVAALLVPHVERFDCELAPVEADMLETLMRVNAELERLREVKLQRCEAIAQARRANEAAELRERIRGTVMYHLASQGPVRELSSCLPAVLERQLGAKLGPAERLRAAELGVLDAARAVVTAQLFMGSTRFEAQSALSGQHLSMLDVPEGLTLVVVLEQPGVPPRVVMVTEKDSPGARGALCRAVAARLSPDGGR
jgi:hypothetical protein